MILSQCYNLVSNFLLKSFFQSICITVKYFNDYLNTSTVGIKTVGYFLATKTL